MHCVSKKFHFCCFPNFLEHVRLPRLPAPSHSYSCWLFIYFIFLWCCIFQWWTTLAAIIFSCLRTSCAPRRVVTLLLLTLQTQLRDFMFGSYLLCQCECVCVWGKVAVFQVSRSVGCFVLHEYLIVKTTDQDVRRIHTHRRTLYFTFVNHLSSAIGNFTVSGVAKTFHFIVEFESRKKIPFHYAFRSL